MTMYTISYPKYFHFSDQVVISDGLRGIRKRVTKYPDLKKATEYKIVFRYIDGEELVVRARSEEEFIDMWHYIYSMTRNSLTLGD